MATINGLEWLAGQVRDYFALPDVGIGAVVQVGFRTRHRQDNQGAGRANRVLFVPGDPTGKAGALSQPRGPGERWGDPVGAPVDVTTTTGRGRALREWIQLVTLYVWAVDATAPTNEERQIAATTELLEWTLRAMQAAAGNNAIPGDATWTIPVDRAYGQELAVALRLRTQLYDVGSERVFPSLALTKTLETGD